MARNRKAAPTRSTAFITDYEDQSADDLVIPEDLSALSTDDLTALRTQAAEAFAALYQDGQADLSDDDLTALGALTEGLEALAAEAAVRDEAAETRRAEAAALAARVGGGDVDEADADETDTDEADADEADADETDTDEADADDESLVAGAGGAPRRETRVNLSALRGRQPQRPATGSVDETRATFMAAPDVPGYANGQSMTFSDLGAAVDSRLSTFSKASFDTARARGRHIRQQFGIAVIRKPFPADLTISSNDPDHVEAVFARAVDETRLPGGSLVASGGWCAPSETVYDLFEIESRDGLYSLPEVNISRGGVNFTQGPAFSEIYAEITGFSYTEADDIIGDYDGEGGGSKPCYHVECPDFQEVRLRLDGLCITAGLLQQRGYPEVIARTIRGALVAHAHRMSAKRIAAVVAGSTPVTLPADQVGATAPLLTAVELQVEHYRYTHRLARGTSLEAVFPFWVRGAIRSDLSRRLGVDMLSVSDTQIDGWFRLRGINPQFVYNWQDINGTTAANFTAWPEEVDFLLYAAGTWVAGAADVITLDTIYDSSLLGTNDYTALFTEEGWLVMKRGHDSRVITVPICPTGDTGGGVATACNGTAIPEPEPAPVGG